MCSDENGAPHAARYLNAQLEVLHENAKKCLETHPQARGEDNRQYYALAEFTVQRPGAASSMPSDTDSYFHACFGPPELKFICDHDVLLRLTVESGHVVLDNLGRASRGQVARFQDHLHVTFRVGFETRRIIGNDMKIGDSGSVIELVILDLRNAVVSAVEPEQTVGRDALLRYLNQYLDLLTSAGNHVLFSLPQFSQNAAQMRIAYSLMGTSTEYEWLATIHGVTVEQMNAYMSSLWLKSAMLAYGSITSSTTDWEPRCLAEYTYNRQDQNQYFRIKFGTPHVSVLCSKEVVLEFDIDELDFFASGDFSVAPVQKYTKWKVAMVVNVLKAKGADDFVVKIMFDLTNARYHDALSVYSGLDESEEASLDHRDIIIAFFSEEYLAFLHGAGYHILYEHDVRWENMKRLKFESQEDSDGSWWSLESSDSSGTSSRETIQRARMYGFDQVVAISQGSLNAQFSALCASPSAALLHTWAYEQFFSCTFRPISLHLLSNDRAIVWIHLTNGRLKALRDWAPCSESIDYEFRDWRIAFEVELKMCQHGELEGASSATYKKMVAYEKHGDHPDRELNHIFLALRDATYLHDYSTYGDLKLDTDDSRAAILKLQAVVWYLTQQYFPTLCKEGLNVISSIPVWKTAGLSLPSYALTSVAFHVYSRVEVALHNWAHVTPGQEPIVVVLGATGTHQLPQPPRLEWSTGWVVHANRGFSHGTLSIARRVFLEERLLGLLANVNAQTTLIPLMLDPMGGLHEVSLRKWAEHDQRKGRPSKWQLQPSDGEGCLRYMWEHTEEWRYKMAGTGDMMNATYGVSCITRNYVELPTAVKQGGLQIKVSGKVELGLALQTMDSKSYNATSSVSWSTNVAVKTAGSGIKVSTLGSHDPVFAKADFTDNGALKFPNPSIMLRDAFPHKVDLDELVREISAFEGPWQYYCPLATPYSLASPVFNDDGDLLFELRRHGAGAGVGRAAPMAPGGRKSPAFGRRPASRTRQGGRSSPIPHSPTRSPISTQAGTASAFGEFVHVGGKAANIRIPPITVHTDLGVS